MEFDTKITMEIPDILTKIRKKVFTTFDIEIVFENEEYDYKEGRIKNYSVKGDDVIIGFYNDKPSTLLLEEPSKRIILNGSSNEANVVLVKEILSKIAEKQELKKLIAV